MLPYIVVHFFKIKGEKKKSFLGENIFEVFSSSNFTLIKGPFPGLLLYYNQFELEIKCSSKATKQTMEVDISLFIFNNQ